MIKKKYLVYLSIILFLIIATIFIAYTKLDLILQGYFYHQEASEVWYQANHPAWHWAYFYGTIPAIVLTVIALIVLISSWLKSKYAVYRKYCWLILLTLIIGPGVLINGILKDHWGRPRPRQVQEFGGQWKFKEVWQPGVPGKGKSFPCGHCSMGFIFIVLYFSFKRRNQLAAYSSLVFSVLYGSYIGLARVAQGGHFLSDVVWAGGLTFLIAAILYYDILKIPIQEENQTVARLVKAKLKSNPLRIILIIGAAAIILLLFLFVFLFSKPFYKEYLHQTNQKNSYQYIKFDFETSCGDIILLPSKGDTTVAVKTIVQGYGFPRQTFKSELTDILINDTLLVNYNFESSGHFYELDVNIFSFLDTSKIIFISGQNKAGNLFVDKNLFARKFINTGIQISNGTINDLK